MIGGFTGTRNEPTEAQQDWLYAEIRDTDYHEWHWVDSVRDHTRQGD